MKAQGQTLSQVAEMAQIKADFAAFGLDPRKPAYQYSADERARYAAMEAAVNARAVQSGSVWSK
jgi:hypothetical protein